MTAFKTIRARAEKRKGGPKALAKLLPPRPDPKALARLGDDRILAEMTKRAFSAGFAWSVIESKWPGFEKAFLGFKPGPLSLKPDEFWDDLMKDTRIVRNGAKIMSVRANASFVRDIAREHGSFGKFLANWPSSHEAGLLELLAKRGSRLGGNTGQMMLRFIGWDGFVTSRDVVLCLRDAGLDIAETVTSKRDLAKVQAQADRTLYRFDVRSEEEYAAGHLAGFRHYPGGQLVQEIDMAAPVRGARIVLTDNLRVRADMTASWLAQMGWETYVLEGGYNGTLEIGPPLVIPKPDPSHRYRRPYEGTDVNESAMQAYLDWEYGLVEQLRRDATHGFFVI